VAPSAIRNAGSGKFGRREPRSPGQRIPDAEFPRNLEQASRVVAGHQVIQLADLVGERG
jgi:hypothetical protein